MPIAYTPFAHFGELPVATKWTGDVIETPLPGDATVTPANIGNAQTHRHTTTQSFAIFIWPSWLILVDDPANQATKVVRILGTEVDWVNHSRCGCRITSTSVRRLS